MKNHWDNNLKVKNLVIKHKPKFIVELGAGGGDNTIQYLTLRKKQPFEFLVISDGELPDELKNEDFTWIYGISFIELPKLKDYSIDFCSIDTDHNYWTLKQELTILNRKMKRRGIVVLHDTESYKNSSGTADGYNCGVPYPPEIHTYKDRGMYDAVREEIQSKQYKVIKQSRNSCGATALKKL